MRHVVAGFAHRPGMHCASTAMADALRPAGLDLTEELALGLGAGLSFHYFRSPGLSPTRFFLGRSVSFEHDLCALVGVHFDERSVSGFAAAWRQIRDWLDADRPVLALTDVRWLPHYASNTHFNGHRIVIAGYDGGHALLADSHFPGLVEVPLADLERAMTSDVAPVMTSDCIFGVLDPLERPPLVPGLAREAIRANAAEMLVTSETTGVSGIEALGASLPAWAEAPDAAWCARFAYQVIEKRGCGGGLFRRMYARFLDQAGLPALSRLASDAADCWSRLAAELKGESEAAHPRFEKASALTRQVALAERALWERASDTQLTGG